MNNVAELRHRTGLSQANFGKKYYDIPYRTVQNWESKTPDGSPKYEVPEYLLRLLEFRVDYDTLPLDEFMAKYPVNNVEKPKVQEDGIVWN